MNFRDMFPSKFLSCQDIEPNRMYTVTIAGMRPLEAKVQATGGPSAAGFGNVPNSGFGQQAQPEVLWAMYFREFNKPYKLKPYKAEAIFAALGEENPEKWIGRQIRIFAGSVMVGGKSWNVVLVDPTPVMGPALPAAVAPVAPAFDTRPIGVKNADKFRGALAEQGATVDEFITWVKHTDARCHEAIHGRELFDWPHGGAPLMHRFLREYQSPKAPAPEISFGSPAAPAAAPQAIQPPAPPIELPEEDIPF